MLLLLILAYLGGVLTILSPCILPVLPFIFARADRPFARNGLPMLAGMALTFAAVATLAALGGGWAVHANQYGRIVALVVLAVLGLTLLSNRVGEWITHPFVTLGNTLTERSGSASDSVLSAAGLGVATGLLWAPCAGPILGLLLTGAALNGASLKTTFLLLTYAAGAATSLALALLIGGRVFAAMKRPGAERGMDIDAGGNGTVAQERLYQLVRLADGSGERTFEIIFLDPGVMAYAFTFG